MVRLCALGGGGGVVCSWLRTTGWCCCPSRAGSRPASSSTPSARCRRPVRCSPATPVILAGRQAARLPRHGPAARSHEHVHGTNKYAAQRERSSLSRARACRCCAKPAASAQPPRESPVPLRHFVRANARARAHARTHTHAHTHTRTHTHTPSQIGVYMDNRLVYALEGGAWKPIPLDRLVDRARAAPGPAS